MSKKKTPPILTTIKSRLTNADGLTSVQIGDNPPIQAPSLPDGAGGGFQVVVLDRLSLNVSHNESYATASSEPIAAQEKMFGFLDNLFLDNQDVIVIISSIKRAISGSEPPSITKDLINSISNLGGRYEILIDLLNSSKEETYSLISFPKSKSIELSSIDHANHTSFNSNIIGRLVQGIDDNYSFVYPDYIPFHSNDSNSVKIGDSTYAAPVKEGQQGFQVCVVHRDTLELISNDFFATGDKTIEPQTKMITLLDSYANNENALFFFTSIGSNPIWMNRENDKDWEKTYYLMAVMSESYGGTLSILDAMALKTASGKGYSFVGHSGLSQGMAAEAGPLVHQNSTPHVVGVLHQNAYGWYEVASYNNIDGINNELYPIIYAAPSDWPIPTKGNKEEELAYQYISEKASGTDDIRSAYTDLLKGISSIQVALNNVSYVKGNGFTETVFNKMLEQLKTETLYVGNVQNLFDQIKGLTKGLTEKKNMDFNTVITNLQIPKNSTKSSDVFWLELIRGAFMVAAIAVPEASPMLGLGSAAIYIGMDLSNASGNAATTNQKLPVNKMKTEINKALFAAQKASSVNETIILTDWEKLQKIGYNIKKQNPGWVWTTETTVKIMAGLNPGFRLYYYKILMPLRWFLVEIKDVDYSTPADYSYIAEEPRWSYKIYPYKDVTKNAFWKPDNNAPWNLFLITNSDTDYPQTSLTDDLFGTEEGQLGVNKSNFYQRYAGWNLDIKPPKVQTD